MAVRVGRKAVFAALAALLGILLAWAWIDGGVEPVRPISETVVLPEVRS